MGSASFNKLVSWTYRCIDSRYVYVSGKEGAAIGDNEDVRSMCRSYVKWEEYRYRILWKMGY